MRLRRTRLLRSLLRREHDVLATLDFNLDGGASTNPIIYVKELERRKSRQAVHNSRPLHIEVLVDETGVRDSSSIKLVGGSKRERHEHRCEPIHLRLVHMSR